MNLSPTEQRVLGCLLEKAVTTPDQYPLTLNALRNACNQKSSRHPVLALDPGDVERAVRSLEDQHLVTSKEDFRSRVVKVTQRWTGTPFASVQLDSAQYAVLTLLLLRGAQTPGELRSNSGRLHTFADNAAAQETLDALRDHEHGALVVQLPKQPGRRDHAWTHLLGGEVDVEEAQAAAPAPSAARPTPVAEAGGQADAVAALEARVATLEEQVAELLAR